ncbi:MAG: hypothetical protein P8171_12170 [Candidatus Thiodiazotropha sp.]|jgi:hypothetical protein
MQTVYDMSTGQMVEIGASASTPVAAAQGTYELELRLLPVTTDSHTQRQMPPELVLADLNAFLETMS